MTINETSRIIELENISYSVTLPNGFSRKILKNLSIEFQSGHFYSIKGPSGSGKTTLLQILGNIISPDEGKRTYYLPNKVSSQLDGTDPTNVYKIRTQIGYLFQAPYLPSNLSVEEYLSLVGQINKIEYSRIQYQISFFLDCFSVTNLQKEKIRLLSGGEKQTIALISLLLNDPLLLLLDEPTGSIDFEGSCQIRKHLNKLKAQNRTIITVTHDNHFDSISDDIFYLQEGQLIQKAYI